MWVRGKPLRPQQTSSCFTLVLSCYRRDTTGPENRQWHDSMFQTEAPRQAFGFRELALSLLQLLNKTLGLSKKNKHACWVN